VPTPSDQLERNKALVRRSLDEIYTGGNVDAIEEVFAPDFVGWDPTFPGGVLRGPAGIRGNVERGHASFERWRFDVEDVVAEGDRVVTRVVMRGRSKGEFLGMAPTGREVEVSGITIHRIADGRIVERWGNWNTIGMLQQLGRLPLLDQIG
jgi:steroid delta-isomerase-like uncharacterized protein